MVNNLDILERDQGKMAEPETMDRRALGGEEQASGPQHKSTMGSVNNLGKMEIAEATYRQALKSYEKAWGQEHMWTLNIINNLGNVYADQGKMGRAKAMYLAGVAKLREYVGASAQVDAGQGQ